jgi:quercetin dioxygenase-like cupin family protein
MGRVVSLLIAVLACAVLAPPSDSIAAGTREFVRLRPEQLRWQALPGSYGVRMAAISGDPAARGIYVQRVRFPPHVMDRPHWHPNDRYVTVLKGTWYTGTGATFDPARAVPLPPGSFMFHPARALHWDGSNSDEEVIVQISGMGPADSTPADPAKPFWVQLR